MMSLKYANHQMYNSKEELEQYGRRLCLRINGAPVKWDETSDDVLKYIKEIFDEGELDIPDTVTDRAHRITPECSDYKIKKKRKAIIVRFTTLRHKTLVYWARKKIRNNVKIRLDLTKERHDLLLEANNLVEGNNDVKFSFVDIVAWKSNGRMNYCQIVFYLHWKIWKVNYRLMRIITLFPSSLLFHFFSLLLVSNFSHLFLSWR